MNRIKWLEDQFRPKLSAEQPQNPANAYQAGTQSMMMLNLMDSQLTVSIKLKRVSLNIKIKCPTDKIFSLADINIRTLRYLCYICERALLGVIRSNCGTDPQKTLRQNEVFSGSDHQLVPGFPSLCSETFLERFRSASASVGSGGNRPIWTEYPKCGTRSC